MGVCTLGIYPFKVGINAHVGHGRQDFRKAAPLRTNQRCGQDGPVFSLGALAMRKGLCLERLDDGFIDPSNQQIGH
jgi:hypothetical protein